MNELLHELRTRSLRAAARPRVLLSAGCSGEWYFDWIESNLGPLQRHVGVELYAPRPARLPDRVEWVVASVSSIYSGQNLEHLWPDEVVGFFEEASRVLVDGGALLLDSPNHEIAQRLGWTQPEHTVEYTPEQACRLAEAGGFDVESLHGLWLCRDPDTGVLLPFAPRSADDPDIPRRIDLARSAPGHSFIWWLTARRRRAADRVRLREGVEHAFQANWPQRASRFSSQLSPAGSAGLFHGTKGWAGALVFGPYVPLRRGRYRVEFEIAAASPPDPGVAEEAEAVRLDVVHEPRCVVAAVRSLTCRDILSPVVAGLDFGLDELTFGVQFRVITSGRVGVTARVRPLALPDGSPMPPPGLSAR